MPKIKITAGTPAVIISLFFTERHAISALILRRIALVGTNQNSLQRAVVCFVAVMCALMNSTLNTLVCIAVHNDLLLFL